MRNAGSLLVRARASLARRRYAVEFEGFRTFLLGFPADKQRCLRADESQSVADDAVLLGLLDAVRVPRSNALQPSFYDIALGYRRRNAQPIFREWLLIREGRAAATH